MTTRYGPYKIQGYWGFIDVDDMGKHVTVMQHRAIIEDVIGRKLATDEQVHHKNGVKTDNRPENLEIIQAIAHHKLHARRQLKEPDLSLVCMLCGKTFLRKPADARHNRKLGKAGPFCSRHCAGVASHNISAVVANPKMEQGARLNREALRVRISPSAPNLGA